MYLPARGAIRLSVGEPAFQNPLAITCPRTLLKAYRVLAVLLRALVALEMTMFRPCVAMANLAVLIPVRLRMSPGLIASVESTTWGFSVVNSTAVMDFAGSVIVNLFAKLVVALVEPPLTLALTASSFRAFFLCDTNVSPVIPARVSVLNFVFASKFSTFSCTSWASFSARFTNMTVSESPLFVMELYAETSESLEDVDSTRFAWP